MRLIVARLALVPCCIALGNPVAGQSAADLPGLDPIRLQASNPVHSNQFIDFGSAVALDGDVLAVGAPGEDHSTSPGVPDTGAVYVFVRQGATWVELQKLRAPVESATESFGKSLGVAVGDDGEEYLIVGAPGSNGSQGRAYLFRRTNPGLFTFEVDFLPVTPVNGNRFGQAVAIDFFVPPNSLSGDPVFVVVVGEPNDRAPGGSGSSEGSISIFQRSGDPATWGRSHEFFGDLGERLGGSVAIAGPVIVAGLDNSENARSFRQENELPGGTFHYAETWTLLRSDPQIGNGPFSAATADHGVAVMGAPLHDQGAVDAGKVYVFDLDPGGAGTTREESAALQPAGLAQGSNFGAAVALSGRILAVGAPRAGAAGSVFLYQQGADVATWSPAGQVIPPPVPVPYTCYAGDAVAVRGHVLAVGCPSPQYFEEEGVYLYDGLELFADDFESGDISLWSASFP